MGAGGKTRAGAAPCAGKRWHALAPEAVAAALDAPLGGLSDREAALRLSRHGRNLLPAPPPPSAWSIVLRQFKSPLIYVLLGAAVIALALGHASDAGFIAAVLAINAAIGFTNEHRAEREVQALQHLVRARARVRRGRRALDVDGEQVVPGDLLLLESGSRICADVRLLDSHALRIDESLLTGESMPVAKDAGTVLDTELPLADQVNMAFAGSLVASGRGMGLVVGTGRATAVGTIAGELSEIPREPTPLLVRMERFARLIGVVTVALSAVLVLIGLARGEPFGDLLLVTVALAVSAIPEGLPIALTVALAVAVSRMARRGVVVRNLPAVEGLGSCGVIATDKTGTLTRNELTVERIVAAGLELHVTGQGYAPEGEVQLGGRPVPPGDRRGHHRLFRAACLANEATLVRREPDSASEAGRAAAPPEWEWSGDPTDVALLSVSTKAGHDWVELRERHGLLAALPFEPERRYAASFHRADPGGLTCVKGAPERVIDMCAFELGTDGASRIALDRERAHQAVESLMREGYRVLAIAEAETPERAAKDRPPREPADLVLLGLVAMTDPPRERVPEALESCRRAGIHVLMVTGDHATTARSIAERIGLSRPGAVVLTGTEIAALDGEALAERVADVAVVARATPTDKLRVVEAWQRRGALIAVTGDGVNDAPALRQANLGVAMGRSGTDVAREAADLVITDDDFASIVSGVEEGRVAYDNVRKATFLLVSTGLGEVVIATAAMVLGLPIPFSAVQLLWLNLVTNGIQGVALAFEPGEPGVLDRSPRPPREHVFDALMTRRTLLAGAVFGVVGISWLWVWNERGVPIDEMRNLMVQLLVLFEVFHIGNCRSERISLLRRNPLLNPVLFLGTLGALAVHAAALYAPFTQKLLGFSPLGLREWAELAASAATIMVVMEAHKLWVARRTARRAQQP